ncbi:hypothetical protein HQQ94_19725 [Shewanella sp. VB17]|uniref:hypothetical protein n=1 Tax=Shewanella sp. VB17 TaxID=2739432 RepID=UPI001566AD63|nr:hypothetical protein [Shewanella sp. VB17]NRD75409.1 hypothetical protein [Shewanella sp. VB17]
MKVIIAAISILAIGNATAICDPSVHMLNIPYPKNSSHFPNTYSIKLDAIGQQHKSKTGYLLLEFQVQKEQISDELRTYNLWLAQRRIDRVKNHLINSNFSAPVITRIFTESLSEQRNISISWCSLNQPKI